VKSFRTLIPEPVIKTIKKTFLYNLYLRRQLSLRLPYAINIELTNKCNLSCIMCPRPKLKDLKVGDMDFELFEKILDDLRLFTNWNAGLTLVGLGEPLMYPRLEDAITLAKKIYPQIPVILNTNGVLLNKERSYALTRLMGAGDCIYISLNASNAATYKWLMGADKYDLVVHNTKQLLSIRKTSKNAQKMKVNIQIFITKNTSASEIREFKNFWTQSMLPHDEVSVQNIASWSGVVDTQDLGSYAKGPKRYPCIQLWTTLAIDHLGYVYPCCGGFAPQKDSPLILGNVREEPLAEIYSKGVSNIRNAHLNDEYDSIPECANCDFYAKYPNIWIRNRLPIIGKKWI